MIFSRIVLNIISVSIRGNKHKPRSAEYIYIYQFVEAVFMSQAFAW
jgi:hypothetical protein